MPVRPVRIDDADKIAETHITSWQTAYRGMIPDSILDNLSIENRTKYWEEAIELQKSNMLVYEHNQRVVGFINFGPSRDKDVGKTEIAEIYAIYLAPHAYRQGYGSKLLNTSLGLIRQQSFKKVSLWVLAQNTAAQKFYQAHGFSATGKNKTDFFKDGTQMNETQYLLTLT